MARIRFPRAAGLALTLALCALVAPVLLACGGSAADEAIPADVTVTSGPRTSEVSGNKFESPMRIAVGSEVTWVNKDGVAHNLIGSDGAFKSSTLNKGDTFTHTFDAAGRFTFTCAFHAGMDGVIEVQ